MFDTEDMKTCIHEWMAEALTPEEIARTYAVISAENDRQLDHCMSVLVREAVINGNS